MVSRHNPDAKIVAVSAPGVVHDGHVPAVLPIRRAPLSISAPARSTAARADHVLWLALVGMFLVHVVTRAPWVGPVAVALACARVAVWVYRIARWGLRRVRRWRVTRQAQGVAEHARRVVGEAALDRGISDEDARLLAQVQVAFEELGEKLGSMAGMPALEARDGAFPFVVVRNGVLHLVAVERGQEVGRDSTENLGELLHWAALRATGQQAMSWELERRHRFPESRDSRIGWLARQVQLLGRVNEEWAREFRAGIPAQCPGVRLEDVDAHPLD